MKTNEIAGRRGAVLAMVMIMLVVVAVVCAGLLQFGAADRTESSKYVASEQCFWAGEAGLCKVRAWAQSYRVPFEKIPGFSLDWTEPVGACSVRLHIEPDAMNATRAVKYYVVTATATSPGGMTRILRQNGKIETYASYMHASRYERTTDDQRIYFGPGDRIEGMVYVNDQINLYGGDPDPVFAQLVRSHADSVNYRNGADVSSFLGGLTLGAPTLAFDENQNHVASLRSMAENGGLSFEGDQSVRFTSNGTIEVRQGTNAPIVRNLVSFNGVVYVNGSVAALSGTVNGSVTIAARDTIRITSNVVYASAPPNAILFTTNFDQTTIHDSLGLVANTGVVVMGTAPVNIHAAIMVTQGDGGFSADRRGDWINTPYINLYGSISQYRRGVVGYVDGRGFRKNYKFTVNFLNDPPPFFPYSVYLFDQWRQDGR